MAEPFGSGPLHPPAQERHEMESESAWLIARARGWTTEFRARLTREATRWRREGGQLDLGAFSGLVSGTAPQLGLDLTRVAAVCRCHDVRTLSMLPLGLTHDTPATAIVEFLDVDAPTDAGGSSARQPLPAVLRAAGDQAASAAIRLELEAQLGRPAEVLLASHLWRILPSREMADILTFAIWLYYPVPPLRRRRPRRSPRRSQ